MKASVEAQLKSFHWKALGCGGFQMNMQYSPVPAPE